MVGWSGGVRSMVKSNEAEGALVLPARSVSVRVMACAPSASGVSGVKDHLPSVPTVAWPTGWPLS
ncbi:hypothetical protein D3C76_1474210 [compost metagenome]